MAAASVLVGCAESFNANVARFQTMPAPSGQSYTIRATEAAKASSLEFAHYAGLVSAKLTAQGYRAATTPETATLVVSLDYGVDKGKRPGRSEFVTSYMGYGGYGGYGVGYGGYGGGYGGYGPGGYHGRSSWRVGVSYGFDPFMFGGSYDRLGSSLVYSSALDMKIENKASGQRVFEGHATADSAVDTLSYLVPNLIDAMFTGFPGNSGETIKITVAPPKKG